MYSLAILGVLCSIVFIGDAKMTEPKKIKIYYSFPHKFIPKSRNAMRWTILWYSALVALIELTQAFAYSYRPSDSTASLLERLDSAEGHNSTLNFLKVLTIVSDDAKKEDQLVVFKIIESAEEIVVYANGSGASPSELQTMKILCDELIFLDHAFKNELGIQRWTSLMSLHKRTLSRGIKLFIAYELYALESFFADCLLYKSYPESLSYVITRLLSSRNALLAGVKTLQLMKTTSKEGLHRFIMENFNSQETSGVDGEDLAFAISSQRRKQNEERANDFSYLRANALVLVKSGVFLMLCASIRVYVCAFIFGALMVKSSVIWIMIYLQLMDSEL